MSKSCVTLCIQFVLFIAFINYAATVTKQSHLGGAVVTNGLECARIGRDILLKNGSAADATIAALLCEGVACPHNTGLGGGFLATIYIKETGQAISLNAREVAPLAATSSLFANQSEIAGPRAIAVPAALKGYWELHKRYGKLPWADLIQPTIDLCVNGTVVSPFLAKSLIKYRLDIFESETLREIFVNRKTGNVWRQGDRIRRPQLAETLRILSQEGAGSLYSRHGSLLAKLMHDLSLMDSILSTEDFLQYRVRWQTPVESELRGNQKVYTSPLPSTGFLVSFVLKMLDGFQLDDSALSYHRFIETLKFAFAERTKMADPRFEAGVEELSSRINSDEYISSFYSRLEDNRTYQNYSHYGAIFNQITDHGTTHINVLAPNGDAIATTSSINRFFGSKLRSRSTDIILNDLLDDFSWPGIISYGGIMASPINFIKPGKQPLSSMSPTIVVDEKNDVRMVIGAAGGPKITSTVSLGIIRHLYLNHTLRSVITDPRIHHQLLPMKVSYEAGFDRTIINGLRDRGHDLSEIEELGCMTAIARNTDDDVVGFSDPRRAGSVELV